MGKIITVRCGKCDGDGEIDDHYDSEKQEWVKRTCPSCSGSKVIHYYQNDDGTYSDPW